MDVFQFCLYLYHFHYQIKHVRSVSFKQYKCVKSKVKYLLILPKR